MIDVLNACGIDIAIFGNHETDIPHKALLQRIHESRFVWVCDDLGLLSSGEFRGGGSSCGVGSNK